VSPARPIEAPAVAAGAASPQPQASLPAPPTVDAPRGPGLVPPDHASSPAAPPLTTAAPPPALVANSPPSVSAAAASLTPHQTGVRSIVGTVSEPAAASANGSASPVGGSAPNVVFAAAALSSGGGDAGGAPDDHAGETLLPNVDGAGAAEPELTPFEPTAPTLATDRREAPPPVRATSETAAALAAEMARKLDARVTRFELRLDPGGLGQVQVALEIQSGGEVTAHLRFDRPEAMHELRARADELRETLQQAGFSVASGSLSFESRGDGHRPTSGGPSASGLADAAASVAEPPSPSRAPRRAAGLDLRI
jgi:flagellar hook-length control protein FliK